MTKEEMEEYTTLDTDQCKWWVNHLFNIAKEKAFNANVMDDAKEIQSAQDKIIKVLEQEPKWIPVSKKTPKELTPVNITWINRNPESYYKDIKDKPFSATGVYYKGKWHWYSAICEDMLAEYGRNEVDEIDADIEITAWMPLPKPYKSEVSE